MSRGIGKLQNQILENIPKNSPIEENKLLWILANYNKRIIKKKINDEFSEGFIENSFYKSFKRSIGGLEDKHIFRMAKKINDINELFELYPYKTKKYELLQLRKKILPSLLEYITKEGYQQFSVSNTEHHLLDEFERSKPKKFKKAKKEWRRLESKIIILLCNRDVNRRDLLSILIKGRAYFFDNSASYEKPLFSLIHGWQKKIENNTETEEDKLFSDILTFYKKYFDQEQFKYNRMKSKIYSAVQLGSGLKDERVKSYLWETNEKFISSLPGHKDPPPKYLRFPREYSNYLDKLIDTHIFTPYNFISHINTK